ncbi:hypothetical protein ACS0PU_012932 [Formica fusca]
MIHAIADSALTEFFRRNSEVTRDEKEREKERRGEKEREKNRTQRCKMCGSRVVETETNKTASGADGIRCKITGRLSRLMTDNAGIIRNERCSPSIPICPPRVIALIGLTVARTPGKQIARKRRFVVHPVYSSVQPPSPRY